MRYLVALFVSAVLLESCTDTANGLTEKTFTAPKVGWTINLPGKNWQMMDEQELRKAEHQGKELAKSATKAKVDNRGTEHLIGLKKNMTNLFMASVEAFDSTVMSSYEQFLSSFHQITKTTYEAKKIPAEYEMGATRIDGLMLDRFIVKLMSPEKNETVIFQEIYTCLINKHILTISLMYDNDRDKETLQNILQSSNFSMNSNL